MSISIKEIFEAMPARFDGEAAGEWAANIQFCFNNDNGGENWFVSIAEGNCNVGEGDHDSPSATINTSSETWIGMITGSQDPMQAFMSGKLKVEGNIGDVMKLQNPKIFRRV